MNKRTGWENEATTRAINAEPGNRCQAWLSGSIPIAAIGSLLR